jgi:hypothetical protein
MEALLCPQVAQDVWAQTFKYLADQKVLFEGILLKPAMVTPGADSPKRASPDEVADYTLKLLRRRVPPAVPGAIDNFPSLIPLHASLARFLSTRYVLLAVQLLPRCTSPCVHRCDRVARAMAYRRHSMPHLLGDGQLFRRAFCRCSIDTND